MAKLNAKKAITIFGFDYPDDEVEQFMAGDQRPQVQTRLFARRLTQALQLAFDLPIHCISVPPVSEYPMYQRRLIPKSKNNVITTAHGEVELTSIPHVNFGLAKIISRLIAAIPTMVKRAFEQRGGYIFVYSVHVPFMISGLTLARLTKSKSIAVWTDPPARPLARDTTLFRRVIRRLETNLVKMLARRFDKVIAVTQDLAQDLAPKVPFLVVEAMIDGQCRPSVRYRQESPTTFTYTGGISKDNGVDSIVKAVLSLPRSEKILLKLYGAGDYAEELKKISHRDNRVSYMGDVPHAQALEVQSQSDFLVNPRRIGAGYTRYSFPSKTLEYLSSGVPVLSTRLPGIPSAYWDVLMPLEDASVEKVSKTLVNLSRLSRDQREKIGNSGRELAATKTYIEQAGRIRDFILQSKGK